MWKYRQWLILRQLKPSALTVGVRNYVSLILLRSVPASAVLLASPSVEAILDPLLGNDREMSDYTTVAAR
jgi:hypothetical protein